LLLYSLFLPWFTVTGTRPELQAGTYTGVQTTELLNSLAKGPWGWIAFGWLLVCSIVAIAVAAVGRRIRAERGRKPLLAARSSEGRRTRGGGRQGSGLGALRGFRRPGASVGLCAAGH